MCYIICNFLCVCITRSFRCCNRKANAVAVFKRSDFTLQIVERKPYTYDTKNNDQPCKPSNAHKTFKKTLVTIFHSCKKWFGFPVEPTFVYILSREVNVQHRCNC